VTLKEEKIEPGEVGKMGSSVKLNWGTQRNRSNKEN
jgi:hypothetical protein